MKFLYKNVKLLSVLFMVLCCFSLMKADNVSAKHIYPNSVPDNIESSFTGSCPSSGAGMTIHGVYPNPDSLSSTNGTGSTNLYAATYLCSGASYSTVSNIEIYVHNIVRNAGTGTMSIGALPSYFYPGNVGARNQFSNPVVSKTATFSGLSSGTNCFWVYFYARASHGGGAQSGWSDQGAWNVCVNYTLTYTGPTTESAAGCIGTTGTGYFNSRATGAGYNYYHYLFKWNGSGWAYTGRSFTNVASGGLASFALPESEVAQGPSYYYVRIDQTTTGNQYVVPSASPGFYTVGPCPAAPIGGVNYADCTMTTSRVVGWAADRNNIGHPSQYYMTVDGVYGTGFGITENWNGSYSEPPAPVTAEWPGNTGTYFQYARPDVYNYLTSIGWPLPNPGWNGYGFNIDINPYRDYITRAFYIYAMDDQLGGYAGNTLLQPTSAGARGPCPRTCTFTPPSIIERGTQFSSRLNAKVGTGGWGYAYRGTLTVRRASDNVIVESQAKTSYIANNSNVSPAADDWTISNAVPSGNYIISVSYGMDTGNFTSAPYPYSTADLTTSCGSANVELIAKNNPVIRVSSADAIAGAKFSGLEGTTCNYTGASLAAANDAGISTNGTFENNATRLYSSSSAQYGVFASGEVFSPLYSSSRVFSGNNFFKRQASNGQQVRDAIFGNTSNSGANPGTKYGAFYDTGNVPCVDFSEIANDLTSAPNIAGNWANTTSVTGTYMRSSSSVTIPNGATTSGRKILYVDGRVTIAGDLLQTIGTYATKDNIPYLMIIATNGIYIQEKNDGTAQTIQANLVSFPRFSGGNLVNNSGILDTCSNASNQTNMGPGDWSTVSGSLAVNSCDSKLNVQGSVFAQRILFKRTFGTIGVNDAAVQDPACRIDSYATASDASATSALAARAGVCASEHVNFNAESYLANPMVQQDDGVSSIPTSTTELPPVF